MARKQKQTDRDRLLDAYDKQRSGQQPSGSPGNDPMSPGEWLDAPSQDRDPAQHPEMTDAMNRAAERKRRAGVPAQRQEPDNYGLPQDPDELAALMAEIIDPGNGVIVRSPPGVFAVPGLPPSEPGKTTEHYGMFPKDVQDQIELSYPSGEYGNPMAIDWERLKKLGPRHAELAARIQLAESDRRQKLAEDSLGGVR